VIFLDSNVFMYAAGSPHPHKGPSAELLRRVAVGEIEATTNAEVFQEILHRYRAIGRWEDGRRVFALARRIVPLVEPVTLAVLDSAVRLLDRCPALMARDGLHAASCLALRGARLCSYDSGFDPVAGIVRVTPDQVLKEVGR